MEQDRSGYPAAEWVGAEDFEGGVTGGAAGGEGGRLLYCVCSLEEEETGRVVQAFEQSAEGARFQREDLSSRLPDGLSSARRFVDRSGCFALRPGDAGTDGFFAAGWRRISPEERRSG